VFPLQTWTGKSALSEEGHGIPGEENMSTKQKTNCAKIIVRKATLMTVQMKGEYMYEKPGKIHNRLKLSVK
jgi:hypothetical protein